LLTLQGLLLLIILLTQNLVFLSKTQSMNTEWLHKLIHSSRYVKKNKKVRQYKITGLFYFNPKNQEKYSLSIYI
jgi:hypothetical protein